MTFNNHRTTGSERRGRVAAGNRERERKIAGTKHNDGPQWNLALTQVRTRQWLAIGERRIDANAKPAALAQFVSKQSQLADSSRTLACQPRDRQSRLRIATLQQLIA